MTERRPKDREISGFSTVIKSSKFERVVLNPKDSKGLTMGLLYIGKTFTEHCWPNMEAILKDRLAVIKNIETEFSSYTRLTYLSIVLFFSYVDGTALSTKNLLRNAQKNRLLEPISKKQRGLLEKSDDRITFEELMKVQFSILPHAVGAPVEYGTIKQQSLAYLFKLRKIRNRIVHPSGLYDLIGVDVSELGGKDINTPVVEFMGQLYQVLVRSAMRLIPPENREKADLKSWIRTREFHLDPPPEDKA